MKKFVLGCVLALGLTTAGNATLILVDTFDAGPGEANPATEEGYAARYNEVCHEFLDKDPGEAEFGLENNLDVDGIGSPSATATWNLTGTDFRLAVVLVKGGTLYNVYVTDVAQEVAGSAEIAGPEGKDISHVSFLGCQAVPDGGSTLVLLGSALSALGAWNRRRS